MVKSGCSGLNMLWYLTLRPVVDFGNLGVIRYAAFIIVPVPKDGNFRNSNGNLFSRDSGAGTEKAMEDAMDIIQVFPNEVVDLWVSWNGFIPTILSLIACCGPFDAGVIYKGNGSVWDLWLKDE